jgi:DNA end-binding protein Ku
MVLETLRYADEVNRAASYFRDIGDSKPDQDLLELAESLIEKKTSDFDAKEFENRYIEALKKLIEEKQKKKGKRVIQDDEPYRPAKGSNVIDLMAALKKSLGDEKPKARSGVKQGTAKAAPRRAPAKKAATRARKRA